MLKATGTVLGKNITEYNGKTYPKITIMDLEGGETFPTVIGITAEKYETVSVGEVVTLKVRCYGQVTKDGKGFVTYSESR